MEVGRALNRSAGLRHGVLPWAILKRAVPEAGAPISGSWRESLRTSLRICSDWGTQSAGIFALADLLLIRGNRDQIMLDAVCALVELPDTKVMSPTAPKRMA